MRPIEADALKKALDEQMNFEENCRDSVFGIIDKAPTIIPSYFLNLNDITEEDIVKFKAMWQRANSKGFLPLVTENATTDRQSGHWILEAEDCDNGGNNFYQCSKCFYHDTHSGDAIVPYCWHCGAYMLSEESGQEVSNDN